MNKKGQALVEFIIILPILIMILLVAFDLVNIFTTKMKLESLMEEVVLKEDLLIEEDIILDKSFEDDYVRYKLTENVKISSPFTTLVTDDLYQVSVERVIYNE